jgi:predicted glycosyltransferase
VCLVAVGGSGTGGALLRRAAAALPALRARIPGLRMVALAGPRLDAGLLPQADDLEVRGYVHEAQRLAAACDVALVQGGLATTMELVAAGRPFVSVPLDDHFEQQVHVRHRLDRHGARAWLPWAQATPGALADAVAGAWTAGARHRPVPDDGAARAADALAGLLVATVRG